MGTIVARKRKDGSTGYTGQILIKRKGVIVHREAQTFDRRQAANAWIVKREEELSKPGAIERAKSDDPTLSDAIDRYIAESEKEIGKTKTQVLRTIKKHDIANQKCSKITSADIVSFAQSIEAQPQTRGNYLSHLAAIYAIGRPMWGYPLDKTVIDDAIVVAKRMGITSRSKQRDRRPTLDELAKILQHFMERRKRTPQAMPMHKVIVFALFSTRRQEEIIRIQWKDYEPHNKRVLVRDMKNPGEKIGNDVWVDLPDEAMRVIDSMPRKKDEIFPYSTDAVSANFTRTCKLLGIEDLKFHDLRHEGVSRLFELGWNIPHVAAVSGHKSWTSLKRYTHIRQTGDKYAGWEWLEKVVSS